MQILIENIKGENRCLCGKPQSCGETLNHINIMEKEVLPEDVLELLERVDASIRENAVEIRRLQAEVDKIRQDKYWRKT